MMLNDFFSSSICLTRCCWWFLWKARTISRFLHSSFLTIAAALKGNLGQRQKSLCLGPFYFLCIQTAETVERRVSCYHVINYINFTEEQRHDSRKRSNCNAEAQNIFCDHHNFILKILLKVQDYLIKITRSASLSNIFFESI